MFTSSPFQGAGRQTATIYREVGASTALDGASPHKLVSLLYEALASRIAAARGALARRDVAEKGRAISHAVRILEEGLHAPLDMNAGTISTRLAELYDYMVRQLTLGNLRNDDALLAECARLTETLRDGWDGIASQVHADAQAAA